MPSYDSSSHQPAAPVARVMVRNPETGQQISNVPVLIDTGAEVSFLPARKLRRWSLPQSGKRYQLEAIDGRKSYASAYHLEVVLQGRIFRGRFLLIEQDYGILGRNILNHLPLLLDGPQLSWKIGR